MTEGLKLIQVPGRYYYAVTRVGWLRRIAGDEYELVNAVTVLRTSGMRRLDELASEGPKKDHRVSEHAKAPEELHRFGLRRCFSANEKVWREHCPKPKDWTVREDG